MKREIVNIDFKQDQGVILNWNYGQLYRKGKYHRHLFVLMEEDLEQARNFLVSYINLIKPGDLFIILFKAGDRALYEPQWNEKTFSPNISPTQILQLTKIGILGIQQAFSQIQKALQQITEPPILNFVVSKLTQAQAQKIRVQLQKRQKEGKFRFANSIFGNFQTNSLTIHQGSNLFSIEDHSILQFYHQHLNQIAAQYARLTITCSNGEINSCQQSDWHNCGFNRIQRYYYAPTTKYSCDILHFINSRITLTGSYQLDINLEFKRFNGTVYHTNKKVVINFDHSEMYTRSVAAPKRKKVYVGSNDVQFKSNPYCSETVISFQKGKVEKRIDQGEI